MPLFSYGSKYLVMMRGCPGSGKSFLAQQIWKDLIAQEDSLTCSIHSTDSYFIVDGVYTFDPSKLGIYHQRNQDSVTQALEDGIDVVIVDNTNLTQKECAPYVSSALSCGYIVRFLLPQTEWAWDVDELVKRNQHGVPREAIERMVGRFQDNDSVGEHLAEKFGAYYDIVTESLFKADVYDDPTEEEVLV